MSDALAGIDADPERLVSLCVRIDIAVARTRGDADTGARQPTANDRGATIGLGVTPGDFGRVGGGLETDIGRRTIFVRSDVATGGAIGWALST